MPTVKMKATKMSDAKVSFISLVERGANRIPFKIVKQEKDMSGKSAYAGIDLADLFTRKAEQAKPEQVEVVGVVTLKGEGFESVKAQLESSGVKVSDAVEMEDGSVVFKQQDGEMAGEGEVVRISDHVALIVKGFRPYMMDMEIGGEAFSAICKSQGFYPGVGTVMDVLSSGVMQAVEKAEDPSKAAAAVSAMFDEAKAYVSNMVSSLPSVAFKSEFIEPEMSGDEDDNGGQAPEEEITCKACGSKKKPADMVKKADGSTDDTCSECHAKAVEQEAAAAAGKGSKEPVEKADGLTDEKVSAIVQTQVGSAMEALTKKMEEMVSGLTGQVTQTLKEVEEKVSQAEAVAKAASEKVSGIVVTGGDHDDHDAVQKTERAGFGGREFDTAFMPRSIRKAAGR